ncbi:hypothetical protein HC928_20765 [bacterium]|nr:hypothetical protein [bacterium]
MAHREHQTPLEHRRTLRLAKEYIQKGYSVKVYPSSDELPPALASCAFDLVALGEGKAIAVAVRSRQNLSLNGAADLRRMTNLVNELPAWELELVVTNPRQQPKPMSS